MLDLAERDWVHCIQRVIGAIRDRWWSSAMSGHLDWITQMPREIMWFLVAGDPVNRIAQLREVAAEPYEGKTDPRYTTRLDTIRRADRRRYAARLFTERLDLERAFQPVVFQAYERGDFSQVVPMDVSVAATPAFELNRRWTRLIEHSTYQGTPESRLMPISARDEAGQVSADFPQLCSQTTLIDSRYHAGEFQDNLCREPGAYSNPADIPLVPPSHAGLATAPLVVA